MTELPPWSKTLPKGWKLLPLKAVADYIVSNVDKHVVEGETPVRLCNYTDVYKNDFIVPEMEFMRGTATKREIARFQLMNEDVVITKDSETWDDIGIPALVVGSTEDLVCGYHLAILRANPQMVTGRFLFRCLQSKAIRIQLELAANGVTRYGIPNERIGRLLLPIPPTEQQERICKFLDRETERVGALVGFNDTGVDVIGGKIQELVRLLHEYRTALISGAVTGKVSSKVIEAAQ